MGSLFSYIWIKYSAESENPFPGLDSSLVAAIGRKILGPDQEIHTFTIGLENAPDFKYAKAVAEHINAIHHEFKYTLQEGIDVIPQVPLVLISYMFKLWNANVA